MGVGVGGPRGSGGLKAAWASHSVTLPWPLGEHPSSLRAPPPPQNLARAHPSAFGLGVPEGLVTWGDRVVGLGGGGQRRRLVSQLASQQTSVQGRLCNTLREPLSAGLAAPRPWYMPAPVWPLPYNSPAARIHVPTTVPSAAPRIWGCREMKFHPASVKCQPGLADEGWGVRSEVIRGPRGH